MKHENHDVVMELGRFIDYDDGVYQWLNLEAGNAESPQWAVVEKLFPYSVTVTIRRRFDSDMTRLFKSLAVAPVMIICNGYQDWMVCHFVSEASAVQFTGLMDVGAIKELTPYNGMPLWNGILRSAK